MNLVVMKAAAFVGLVATILFGLTYWKLWGRFSAVGRLVCDKKTCQVLFSSRYGKVFGLHNFIFGFVYYVALLIIPPSLLPIARIVSWLVVLFSIYLVYALIKLRVPCVMCIISHIANLVIALALL